MKILHFNWAARDVRGGVKYTIGVANERIVAELIGVVLAGIAVSMREVLAQKFSSSIKA